MPKIKIGVSIGRTGQIMEGAREAETLGLDSVWAGEHVLWRYPVHDALMTLAAAAAVTEKVRVGSSIVLLSLKHPLLVAKAAVALDHISNGRAILGIGIGGEYPKEFEALGVPRGERGPRTDEGLEIIRRLWTEQSVSYEGKFYNLKEVELTPRPIQKPHPPLLIAGRRGSIRRTALYGDGWMPYMYTPEMYKHGWASITEMALKANRDPKQFERTLYAFISIDDTREKAARMSAKALGANYAQDFERFVNRYPIIGNPQQCAERIQEFIDAGVEHFILSPAGPQDRVAYFPEIIAKEIAPMIRKGN